MNPDELHGFWLSREAAEDVFRTLATERLADRIHNPGLPADRAPVIVGGLCVLVAVLRRLKADGLVVSLRTLADGVCASLLDGTWPATGGAR
jgi:exopolyphosphatase/guanosine-5'-triphosphate,3'-diphosphate pyrophosphatase